MTQKQNWKYWNIWKQILAADLHLTSLSSAEKDAHRHELHRRFGLPESHTAWTNSMFSRWISRTAPLINEVDIRDRDRENAVWTIERLRAAFVTLLGRDYAHNILADWADTNDLDKIPLQDASHLDLENLRNTLKNRLGRVIQRLKDGELQPGPECPKFGDASQAEIIATLTASKPAAKTRKYTLESPASFNQCKPAPRRPSAPRQPTKKAKPPAAIPAPAPTNRKYCTHPTPPKTPQPHHADANPF